MTEVDLGFTKLEIYDDYVVGRTDEGIHLTMDKHLEAMERVSQHLTSPFGILLDEVNSYSVDFPVMIHMRDDPNIVCVGVVCHRLSTKIALSIGKSIIKKPVRFSSSFGKVEEWVKEQVGLIK